jgi:hypothetical protein
MPTVPPDHVPGSLPPASLYCSLLGAALSRRELSGQPNPSEALGDVVQARTRAMAGGSISAGGASAVEALSDQIAYDVALIRFARCLGITFGPSDFDPPTRGRRVLEQGVADRGVILP